MVLPIQISISRGDYINCVLDARHLTSNTDHSDESWPPQLARANQRYECAVDLMYAYAHTPLDEERMKLTSFSSGDKLFAFSKSFYGLKSLPTFFTKQMSSFLKIFNYQGFAFVYIDDVLLLSIFLNVLNNFTSLVHNTVLKFTLIFLKFTERQKTWTLNWL